MKCIQYDKYVSYHIQEQPLSWLMYIQLASLRWISTLSMAWMQIVFLVFSVQNHIDRLHIEHTKHLLRIAEDHNFFVVLSSTVRFVLSLLCLLFLLLLQFLKIIMMINQVLQARDMTVLRRSRGYFCVSNDISLRLNAFSVAK